MGEKRYRLWLTQLLYHQALRLRRKVHQPDHPQLRASVLRSRQLQQRLVRLPAAAAQDANPAPGQNVRERHRMRRSHSASSPERVAAAQTVAVLVQTKRRTTQLMYHRTQKRRTCTMKGLQPPRRRLHPNRKMQVTRRRNITRIMNVWSAIKNTRLEKN